MEYDYINDPNVCSSSLNEDGVPMTEGETAHKWDTTSEPVECAECGAHMDKDDAQRIINSVIEYAIEIADTQDAKNEIAAAAKVLKI